jgi:NTP pyrophosphatase (non-canonical NTP hydrolase)
MDAIIRFVLGDINLWSPVVTVICGTFAARRMRAAARGLSTAAQGGQHAAGGPSVWRTWCTATLPWFSFWVMGIYGLHGFVMHLVFPDFTAKLIGWPNSPFQYEVAYANLVFGVVGLVAWFRPHREFMRAAVIGFLVWFGCDGIGHVWSLFAQGDTAEFNAGSILYTDLLLPIAGVVLFIGASGRDTETRATQDEATGAGRAFNAPAFEPASTAPAAAPAGTTSDITALQAKILAFARERDWLQFHDPKNLSMAVAVEAGELMEHFRWVRSDESLAVLKDAKTREAIAHEVADVAILLLEFAANAGIDIPRAIDAKMAINAQRYPVEQSRGRADKYDRLGGGPGEAR